MSDRPATIAHIESYVLSDAQVSGTGWFDVAAVNSSDSTNSEVAWLFVHETAAANLSQFQWRTNEGFIFHVHGVTGSPYIVQGTIDFSNWVDLETRYVSFDFTNYISTNYPLRFFRAAGCGVIVLRRRVAG